MSRAEFIKLVTESSAVRTCADAKALFWLRRHACNSCIDSTPSICMALVDILYLRVLTVSIYLFEVVFHVRKVNAERHTLEQDRTTIFDWKQCCEHIASMALRGMSYRVAMLRAGSLLRCPC